MRSRRYILLRLKSRSMKGPRSLISILGDPGADGLKGATKVFKHGRKSPWVPPFSGPFPNGQENAGSWLGTKKCFVLLRPMAKLHLLSSFREFVHDGCYLATVARFVHQAFLTKNEGTTDESKIVSGAQQAGNAIWLIVWPTIQHICPRTQAAFNSLPNSIAGWT